MKKLLLIAILSCASAKADEWLPTMEEPQSGDKVLLNDRTYVLFSESDFDALTNKLAVLVSLARRQWKSQHETESGRRAWHGEKVTTTITTNDAGRIEMVTQYADGYRHVATSEVKRPRPPKSPPAAKRTRPTDIPKRLREARKGVNMTKEVN